MYLSARPSLFGSPKTNKPKKNNRDQLWRIYTVYMHTFDRRMNESIISGYDFIWIYACDCILSHKYSWPEDRSCVDGDAAVAQTCIYVYMNNNNNNLTDDHNSYASNMWHMSMYAYAYAYIILYIYRCGRSRSLTVDWACMCVSHIKIPCWARYDRPQVSSEPIPGAMCLCQFKWASHISMYI